MEENLKAATSIVENPLIMADALAKRLGSITKPTVYRMARAGLIPSVRVGEKLGGLRFIEADVRRALAAHAFTRG
ncbi:MAG: helix-turn-helix domain-containing protein [Nitrospira sp.]